MTLETFFEKFHLFAEAPDAVAKMRELVLQLAVQGKLVDQKRGDGNAAQLLAAISSERDTRAAKLRTPNEPASADSKENAFPIPSNWAWTQLGNIALQVQYGYTASADPNVTEVRMLRITDIQNNQVDWPSVPGCQIESDEAEKYLLSPNDILIARTGGTIGKSFIVPDAPVKSVFASYLIRVTPPQSMAARYLKTFLESPLYWSQLQQMSAGTGQPNVNGQALGRLEIPLPPLAEQKRIVAKVDELMALCDQLERQQQERETRHAALARATLARFADAPTPENLNFLFHSSFSIHPSDLRKSILTLAVQGKLVPQDPNDEPAEEVLHRISSHNPSSKFANRPLLGDDLGALPFKLPEGWSNSRLGSILDPTRGISYGVIKLGPEPQQGGVFILRCSNVRFRRIDLNGIRKITEQLSSEYDRTILRGGEVLINVRGTLGGCAVVPPDLKGYNIAREVAVIPVHQEINPMFLLNVIASPYFQDRVGENLRGIAYEGLNLGLLRDFPIPIPPLAEQRRIVAKVDALMALVDTLETQLATARTTATALLEAAVAELTARE